MDKNLTVGNEKIASLFDPGTFVEIGAYIKREGAEDTYDGVICGYGSISGKLVFAFVQDSDRLKGALDSTGAKKIEMLYSSAIKNGAAVVGIFDSAGAVVLDGSAALGAYGKFISCVSRASGIVPQIAVVDGLCTGMSAVAASLFDFCITVADKAKMYLCADGAKNKEFEKRSAITAKTEAEAIENAKRLVGMLPSNNNDSAAIEASDSPNRKINADPSDAGALIRELCDSGSFIELYSEFGKDLICGFARFGGELVGVVASDSSVDGGKITCKSAKKAAELISFCDRFDISVLTLVNSKGYSENLCPTSAAALASAYANSKCAKVTAVVGNAYGAGFTLLGSKSLGADLEIALPDSVISVMSPESAVAFLMNDRINENTNRADVEKEWSTVYASALRAAEKGDIDDIVEPCELRARICSALYMLSSKADNYPDRKHFRLPL